MKRRILTAMCCWAVLTLAGSTRALAQDDDRAAVIEVLAAVAQFSQEGNLHGMDTLYSANRGVHIIEGAGVSHGWVDYRDNHLAPEQEILENFQYRYFAIEPTVRGDVAWSSFRYELSADTPRGHTEIEGRGSAVLEKTDGRWQIVHMHTSGRPRSSGN